MSVNSNSFGSQSSHIIKESDKSLSYVIRWTYTVDHHNESFYSACKELYDIKTVTTDKLNNIAVHLKNLYEQNDRQNKTLNTVNNHAQIIKVGAKEILIRDIPELIQKNFTNSVASIMNISKQAVEMVYILEDALKTLHLVEKSIHEIEAINHKTKYLALNATIEAVRAGEVGKSFQVVASEVRDLSSDTQRLATNIGSQVSQMAATLNKAQTILQNTAGVDMSDNILAKEKLDEILNSFVENNKKIVNKVQDAITENEKASHHITHILENNMIQQQVNFSLDNVISILVDAIKEALTLRKKTAEILPSDSLNDVSEFARLVLGQNAWDKKASPKVVKQESVKSEEVHHNHTQKEMHEKSNQENYNTANNVNSEHDENALHH